MWRNYLSIAVRNLNRSRSYAFISGASLAVGMAVCLLIGLWIRDELSYDAFHPHADRTYRIATRHHAPDCTPASATTPRPLAEAVAREIPAVVDATRLSRERAERVLVRHRDAHFFEERVFFADSNVFDVFSIPLLYGDPETALAKPFSVVITETTARKYFGDRNPLGETLALRLTGDRDVFDYRVTGVAQDVPRNAHFHFDVLVAYQGHPLVGSPDDQHNWRGLNLYTYVLLRPGAAPEAVENALSRMVETQIPPAAESYRFFLQPLTSIHLHSHLRSEIEPNGDVAYVYLFAAIALAILVLAGINFINLTTARSVSRAREVGVRKALGSGRGQLVGRFLAESVLLSLLALLLALGLVELLRPVFGALAGRPLGTGPLEDGWGLVGLIGFAVLIGVMAGLYPSFVLSSFQPVAALRETPTRLSTGRFSVRRGLVVFQFTIAIVLMVGTVVIYQQVNYVQNKRLGFDKEQVVVLEGTDVLGAQIEAFKAELRRQPGIVRASNAQTVPGRAFGETELRVQGAPQHEPRTLAWLTASYDFVETLGLELVAGRGFSRDVAADSMAIVLNESAVAALGLDTPLGRKLVENERPYTVIGVVEDFHFASLHRVIGPLAIFGPDPWSQNRPNRLTIVRTQTGDVTGTLTAMRATWAAFAPQQPFTYSFLDRDFDALYRSERRTGRLLGVFSGLALLIACLGLFGLAALSAEQRTREIGIRKVLGASVTSIVGLFSREVAMLVLLAFIAATPVAYVALQRWLERFAYRIEISGWIFLGVGLAALAVALLTVSTQALRAALTDPVESLRYE